MAPIMHQTSPSSIDETLPLSIRDDIFDISFTVVLFVIGFKVFSMIKRHFRTKGDVCGKKLETVVSSVADSTYPTIEKPGMTAQAQLQQLTQSLCSDGADSFPDSDLDFSDMPEDWGMDMEMAHYTSDATELHSSTSWLLADEEDASNDSETFNFRCDALVGRDAQGTIEADVHSALEVALASGDAELADSVLATSARLCGTTWLAKACEEMRTVGIRMRSGRAIDVVQAFAQNGRADLAADLWREQCAEAPLADAAALEPSLEDAELYGAVLEACISCGDFEAASRVAGSVGWRAPPTEDGRRALLALARWLARRRIIGPAIECSTAVQAARGGGADIATHHVLLKACVSSNDMSRADVLFQDLVASGTTLDRGIFKVMIRGHRAAGRQHDAMSYFDFMKAHHIQPDAELFDVALDSCLWKDVPALLECVLADMEASDVSPTNGTLVTVLRLYGKIGRLDKAFEAFTVLPLRHSFQLDSRAYSALISACLSNGKPDLAIEALNKMTNAGFKPKARVYDTLLNACVRRGDMDAGVSLVYKALGLHHVANEAASGVAVSPPPADEDVADESAVDEHSAEQGSPSLLPTTRLNTEAHIDVNLVEKLLRLIGRRREIARLGVPLLGRLRQAGLEVSESLAAALLQASQITQGQPSKIHQRRAAHRSWRDFQHQPEQASTQRQDT